MTIYLEDDYQFFEQQEGLYEKVQEVVKQALKQEKVPYEVEISLTIVNKEEICEINRDHRDKNQPTDVLSFPQIEGEAGEAIKWDIIDKASYMNLDTNELMLGDIVLCHEIAREQASVYGHSLEREVCFLVAHSMFHLLGYDHMTEIEEQEMIKKQEEVLQLLKIVR